MSLTEILALPAVAFLVLVLLPLAVSDVAIYTALGLMSTRIILYSLVSLPGLLLVVYECGKSKPITIFKFTGKLSSIFSWL